MSALQSSGSQLFAPLKMGDLTLVNRIVMAPLTATVQVKAMYLRITELTTAIFPIIRDRFKIILANSVWS